MPAGLGGGAGRVQAALAARLDLPIRFTGYADYDAAPALYRAADVFVSPTYAEGFSNTIREAMAAPMPLMAPEPR